MIKKIIVRNFKKHKRTRIELASGINIFRGPSGAGKSSLIRSIIWALRNRPRGFGFANWEYTADPVEVILTDENNNKVKRIRSKTKNVYEINGNEYNAIGADVPADVSKIFNLTDINIQTQFDPFFLISSTGGTITKAINQICDMGIIDDAQGIAKRRMRECAGDAQRHAKNATEARQNADKTAWAIDAFPDLEEAEKLLNEVVSYEYKIIPLNKTISGIKTFKADMKKYRPFLKIDLSSVKKNLSELKDLENSIHELKGMIHDLQNMKELCMIKGKVMEETGMEYKNHLKKYKTCPICGNDWRK